MVVEKDFNEKTEQRSDEMPLVSVGVPVRDGAKSLRLALDSVINQTYRNLEIIISDNCSTDATQEICLEYARKDSRIIYHRQPRFLTALENFRFVLEEARGEYFTWAAHDDTRSQNYISVLLRAMQNDPKPILSFGDVIFTGPLANEWSVTHYHFDNTGLRSFQRMRKMATVGMFLIYGLWKTNILRTIRFPYQCIRAPDRTIMVAAAYIGEFKYVPGPKFIYFTVSKTNLECATYQYGKASFDKFSSVLNFILSTYKASASVGGMLIGIVAALFVAEPHVRHLPDFILQKFRKI